MREGWIRFRQEWRMLINMEGLREEGIKAVTMKMKRKEENYGFLNRNILFSIILNLIFILSFKTDS